MLKEDLERKVTCVSTTASAGTENLMWIPYFVANKG